MNADLEQKISAATPEPYRTLYEYIQSQGLGKPKKAGGLRQPPKPPVHTRKAAVLQVLSLEKTSEGTAAHNHPETSREREEK